MTDRSQISDADREAEAASWIARLDGECSDSTRRAFEIWSADQANRAAFDKLNQLWADLASLSQLAPAERVRPTRAPERRLQLGALAAVVAVALGGAAVLLRPGTSPNAVYETAIGRQDHVALADGSLIELNTDSRIDVSLSKERRAVELKKGEAFFKVAHDPARPFVVVAGDTQVRAVGTAFAVRLRGAEVDVTVTEGRVAVTTLSTVADPVYLGAGESGRISWTAETARPMPMEELERRLAWRSGALVFRGETLDVVVEEVSRYTDVDIRIEDPRLRTMPIGGQFEVGEVDALLEALETSFGVAVTRKEDGTVVLTSAQGRPPAPSQDQQ